MSFLNQQSSDKTYQDQTRSTNGSAGTNLQAPLAETDHETPVHAPSCRTFLITTDNTALQSHKIIFAPMFANVFLYKKQGSDKTCQDLPKICQDQTRSTKGSASINLQAPLAETDHETPGPKMSGAKNHKFLQKTNEILTSSDKKLPRSNKIHQRIGKA